MTASQHPGGVLRHRSHAHEILETLERSNLFLVPLDDERHWYRYHHLFTDVLRQSLMFSAPKDQIARLHDRPCEWYGQNGFVADAYSHALLAGNHARAIGILEENAWSMVLHAGFGMLRRWMQALPADLLSQHPWLCINFAWALVFGESEEAEVQLRAADRQLQAGGSTPVSSQMQGHIAAVRAWIAYQNGEPDRAVVLSRQALELCPQMDPAISSGLITLVAVGCLAQDDLAEGARAFAQARHLAQTGCSVMVEVAARVSLGRVSEMMGRLHEAEAVYREALQRAILLRSPAAAQAYLRLAPVYREWNDLASAKLFAEEAVESWRMFGFVDALALAYLSLAAVLQAQNQLPEADHALAQGFHVVHEHVLEPRLVPELGAMRARLWLAQGKLDDARHWAATRGLSADAKFDHNTEVEYVVLVRLLLAENRVDQALRLLSRLNGAMESAGQYGHLIEVLVLQAVALDMNGDIPSALTVLE